MVIRSVTGLEAALQERLDPIQRRLTQKLDIKDVLRCITLAGEEDGRLVFLQPGSSGSAWSDRKVPIVLAYRVARVVFVRANRGSSAGGAGCTPGVWQELRGFPGGVLREKLGRWADADDTIAIGVSALEAIEVRGKIIGNAMVMATHEQAPSPTKATAGVVKSQGHGGSFEPEIVTYLTANGDVVYSLYGKRRETYESDEVAMNWLIGKIRFRREPMSGGCS